MATLEKGQRHLKDPRFTDLELKFSSALRQGHLALNLTLLTPGSDCCLTTTQVSHFGHVTHEPAMRSAILQRVMPTQ